MQTETCDRFLRLTDIVGRKQSATSPSTPALIPVSASWLWAMVRTGKFPKPIKLGERTTVWRQSAVMAWIAERQLQAA